MSKEPKYYTAEHISKQFEKLTRLQKIDILWDALDYMEQYNGRSKFLCVAMAMGYANTEGESNTYTK